MRPQCAHITRKRLVYYYRRRLPRTTRAEVSLSLGTRSFREAEYRAGWLDRRFNEVLERMTNPVAVAQVLRIHLAECIEADRQQHIATRSGRSVYALQKSHEFADPVEDDLDVLDRLLADAREAAARRDTQGVMHLIRELSIRFAVPDAQQRELGLGVLQVQVQALEAGRDRLTRGAIGHIEPLAPAASPEASAGAPPLTPAESFSVVAAEYLRLRGKDREGGMRGQTIDQNSATFRMFVDVVGDLPFTAVTRQHTSEFLGVLEQLPAMYSKSPEWRSMALRDIAAAPKKKGTVMLAKKTQARHFAALGGLFKHLKSRRGYIGDNPALSFGLKPKRNAKNERPAWTPAELAQLFASPIWAGCESERRRSTPGPHVFRNAMYWLPLLCVFHGARLEEVAQLRRRDVRKESDIWYFNVTDEGDGQLKNENSVRQVPLHPFVVEIGFLDWLGDVEVDRDSLVFSELTPSGADAKLGPTITKKFGRYKRELGLVGDDTVFHSLRHSVVTALIRAGAPQVLRREITGHKQQGEDESRYFKGSDMSGLLRTVSLIRWPEAESVLRDIVARNANHNPR